MAREKARAERTSDVARVIWSLREGSGSGVNEQLRRCKSVRACLEAPLVCY